MIVDFTESEQKKYAYTDHSLIGSTQSLGPQNDRRVGHAQRLRGNIEHQEQDTICRELISNRKVVYIKYDIMTKIISSCH
jgi:hypothetical protein